VKTHPYDLRAHAGEYLLALVAATVVWTEVTSSLFLFVGKRLGFGRYILVVLGLTICTIFGFFPFGRLKPRLATPVTEQDRCRE
jgi:hypothetical protein